jgi:hypothetical protein
MVVQHQHPEHVVLRDLFPRSTERSAYASDAPQSRQMNCSDESGLLSVPITTLGHVDVGDVGSLFE